MVKKFFKLILHDGFIQSSVGIAVTSTLITFFTFGSLSGLAVFLSYLCGYITSSYIFRYRTEIISAISAAVKTFKSNREKHVKVVKCNVCGDQDCDREKIVHKQKPWAGLMVPEEIDASLENLLDRTLQEFVGSWYKNVSVDDSFPRELRSNIRYSASVFLSKVLKINVGGLISKKLIPTFLRHVEFCAQTKEGKTPLYHPALYNRNVELDYLRQRVREVLPFLLEKPQLECSMFSILMVEILAGWVLLPLASVSDSSVLNSLLNLILAPSLSSYPPAAASKKVEFLAHFSHSSNGLHTNTALLPDMCAVMKDKSLLYAFMQFLKDQGAVHILQFCLDIEEFNQRMLSPDLKTEELDILYRDAWDLYSVYFSPHSPDNIGFNPELVMQMRKVLSKDVTKLRTSPPIFQAYEHAYSLLDKTYCPLFHKSDEFYMWLCGPRTPRNQNKSGSSSPSIPGSPSKLGRHRRNESAVLKLSSKVQKIKGALRPQAVLDGQTYDPNPLPLEPGAEFGEELSEEEVERDMSGWVVKIINSESKVDSSTGKLGVVFMLSIQTSATGDSGNWCIERRINDFYCLEAKLTEFHGEFADNRLPPSGLLFPSPPTQPQIYENYLNKLLRIPILRASDLLHWFLTSPVEFIVEDNGLGKLLKKSVGPLSLRKERGQNIEHFIAAYFASTENKGKTKLEWKDFTYELSPRKKRCLTNTVFKNNLHLDLSEFPPKIELENKVQVPKLQTPSDCILYLGVHILKLPKVLIRFLLGILALVRHQIDYFSLYYIEKKIITLLVPQRIAHLINLLQWVVYDKQTKSDPAEVARIVNEKINKLKGYHYRFYRTIFDTFQDPIMNKQLFYTLFDILIEDLFPERMRGSI